MKDIVKGHFNEMFNREEELHLERIAICKACPLYMNSPLGYRCNPNLYLNPDTNETSPTPIDDWFKGCNCRLEAKTRVPDAHCPAGKW